MTHYQYHNGEVIKFHKQVSEDVYEHAHEKRMHRLQLAVKQYERRVSRLNSTDSEFVLRRSDSDENWLREMVMYHSKIN